MINKKIRQLVREEIDNLKFSIILVEIDAITQAKDIARDIHSGQWRKSSPLPYMVHPIRVYQRVQNLGLSKKHQVLALLHDTVEESKNPRGTLDRIKEVFGSGVASLVIALSHDKGVNYRKYLLNLAKKYPTAFDVKIIDILDNLIDKPHLDQKNKYKEAIEYLLKQGIKIESKIKERLFKILGIKE